LPVLKGGIADEMQAAEGLLVHPGSLPISDQGKHFILEQCVCLHETKFSRKAKYDKH